MAVRLVLVGPPGAGKGTQATRLAERLDVPHISTGELFRANLTERTALGVQAQRFVDAGELVPDEVTVAMVRERLAPRSDADGGHEAGGASDAASDAADASKGFVLDGFPRNTAQADALGELLAVSGAELDAVVSLEVPEERLVARLLARGRADDTEDIIRRRQQVYREETAPLLAYYQKLLVAVNAVGDVEEITDRVLDALGAR